MTNVSFDFSGKVALVVGGSRGIGKAVVNQLSEAGALVYYASRSPGQTGTHIKCDITREEELNRLFDHFEKIDFVINVAGTNLCEPIENIDSGEWDRVLTTNLKSFFLICKKAVELMKASGGGKIVNVSSIAGRSKSIVSGVHYTASKAAIIGFTRQLAYEVSGHNINVNVTCPSQTRTEMLEKAMTEKQIRSLEDNIPIKRISSVDEQALPILFLCSEAASYITGAAIDINGGQL